MGIPGITPGRPDGLPGKARIRVTSYLRTIARDSEPVAAPPQPSRRDTSIATYQQVHRLLEAIKSANAAARTVQVRSVTTPGRLNNAFAISASALALGPQSATTLSSTEEINTAPATHDRTPPVWWAAASTAPWSGPVSTARVTIGGTYDGRHGTGTLTFRIDREGIHGEDDLKLKVYDQADDHLEDVVIDKEDPIDTVYTLTNGITVQLGAGVIARPEEFTVDTRIVSTSYSPTKPAWKGLSTAPITLGGTYDGSHGVGTLQFVVDREGLHGINDLTIKVYDPAGNHVQDVDIKKEDPLNMVYTLNNGLTLTLGSGLLLKGDFTTADLQVEGSFATTPHHGMSTAAATISGQYNGAQGSGDLAFVVRTGGTHGTDNLAVDVLAPDGSLIESITILATDPIDTQYQLSNGLTFRLEGGILSADDTFSLSVDHLTPGTVDPDSPFNATGNAAPWFDPGLAVTAGSFTVNGTEISVLDNDTIDSVISRINQSIPDLTASFEAASETIRLVRNTTGFSRNILLANDTSGFLAATKLALADPVMGDGDSTTPLIDVAGFAGISSGTLFINSTAIAIDVEVDSLQDVIARINAAEAGVTAELDPYTLRVSFTADDNETPFVLNGNGTAFFAKLKINAGTYNPISETGTARSVSQFDSASLTRSMSRLMQTLNSVFDTSDSVSAQDSDLLNLRQEIRTIIGSTLGTSESVIRSKFGPTVNFDADPGDVFRFGSLGRNKLVSKLRTTDGANEFREMFLGSKRDSNGLLERLGAAVDRIESDMRFQLGTQGTLASVLA